MLNRVRCGPYRAGRGRVILPADVSGVQQVGERRMVKAQLRDQGLRERGVWLAYVDAIDLGTGWRKTSGPFIVAAGARVAVGIVGNRDVLRDPAGAGILWRRANSRRPRENVLMRRETVTLIGLEHTVAERIGFGHGEIGLNVRRLHVLKLRTGGNGGVLRTRGGAAIAGARNLVGAVHGATVARGLVITDIEEGGVTVSHVVVRHQRI